MLSKSNRMFLKLVWPIFATFVVAVVCALAARESSAWGPLFLISLVSFLTSVLWVICQTGGPKEEAIHAQAEWEIWDKAIREVKAARQRGEL